MGIRHDLVPSAMPPAPGAQAGVYTPDPFAPEEETGWIRDGLRVVRERRLIIAAVLTPAAIALGAYVTLVPSPRLFEARAQVLVEPDAPYPMELGPSMVGGGREESYYETQYRILRSRTLARRTLASLASTPVRSDPTTDAVTADPAPAAVDAVPIPAVDAFLRGLTVAHVPDSRLVDIRFRWTEPVYAARAVNAHLRAFVRQNAELTMITSRQASRWLDRGIAEEGARVEQGEAELQRQRQQDGSLEERKAMVSQRMSELNGAVLRARAERMSKETAYQQVDEARQSGRSLRDLAALVPTAVVQQLSIDLATLQRRDVELSTNYGERHPERIKAREAIAFTESRLDAEVTRAIDALRRDVVAARREEGKMAAALEAQTAESSLVSRQAVDHDALTRHVASDRALLERLQQRARELRLSSDYEVSHVRIIDPAEVPRGPLPDAKWRRAAMGAGASVVLALLLAFGVHVVDERLHTPEDIKTHLGLPYLGMVPRLNAATRDRPLLERGPRSSLPFNEAMRDLRTHVLCTPAGRASRILLVASAGMDEGKTLVATNLATGLAQAGHGVLLIDLDLRRPSLHERFGVPLQPGLAELLSGAASAGDSLRATGVRNLWILTAGHAGGNPGDLIGSAAFKRLLRNLPESFDRIVVDSPPVMAVTDASLVAHEQVGVLFVVSADRTGRRAAQAALERLEAVGARFVGAVLNRVDLRRNGSAYYLRYDEAYEDYVEAPPAPPPDGRQAGATERRT